MTDGMLMMRYVRTRAVSLPARAHERLVTAWNDRTGRSDGNIMFALLFALGAAFVVTILVATVIASSRKTTAANNYTVTRSWADAGIANAMWTLNNPGVLDPAVPESEHPDGWASATTSAEAVRPFDFDRLEPGDPGVKQGCTRLEGSRFACWRWWIPSRYITDDDGNRTPRAGVPPLGSNEFLVYSDAWIQDTPTPPALEEGVEPVANPSTVPAGSFRRVQAVLSGLSTVKGDSPAAAAATAGGNLTGAGGRVVDGRIVYDPAPPSTLTHGLFTRSAARLNGGVQVTSYDSTKAAMTQTGHGVIASGGIIDMDGTVTANRVRLFGADIKNFADRCSGPLCKNNLILDTKALAPLNRATPAQQDASTAWVFTAAHDGITRPLGKQLANLDGSYTVTGDFTIPANGVLTVSEDATPDNPVVVYVTGDVLIGPGAQVNMPADNPGQDDFAPPVPGRFVVYAAGDVVSVGGPGVTTQVAAALYAPRAACSSGSSAGVVDWYGALACDTFSANAPTGDLNWRISYDTALGTAAATQETDSFRNVWSMSNIVERTPDVDANGERVDTAEAPTQVPQFTVTCAVEACTITVEPQPGVTSYDLYRLGGAPDPNAAPEFLAPLFSRTTIDKFLTPATRYEYMLVPKNIFGVGPSATRIAATAPVHPTVTIDGCTASTCDVQWTASPVDGSTYQHTLTRTRIHPDTGQPDTVAVTLFANRETAIAFEDGPTGTLEAGTEYIYTVTSRVLVEDASQTSGYATSLTSDPGTVTALTLPPAPGGFGVTCTTTTCTSTWSPSRSATSYDVYRERDLGTPVMVAAVAGQPNSDGLYVHTDTNDLVPNHKYRYTVVARNRTGVSVPSDAKDVITLPLAATNGTAACEADHCALTWDPNNTIPGPGSDRWGTLVYTLTYRPMPTSGPTAPPTGADLWRTVASTTATTFTKLNLAGGTTYQFRVVTTNTSGASTPHVFTGLTKPDAPTPTVTCTDTGCVLRWNTVVGVPTIDATIPAGYRVERHTSGQETGGQPTWVPIPATAFTTTETGFEFTDVNADAGARVEYKVTAYNPSGDSAPGITGALTAPKPITPTVTCSAPNTCDITWPPAGDAITTYRVLRARPGETPHQVHAATLTANTWTLTPPGGPGTDLTAATMRVADTGLTDGTEYVYAVTASIGGEFSKPVEVPALTVPGKPDPTDAPVCTANECTLAYSRPQSTTHFYLLGTDTTPVRTDELTATLTGLPAGQGVQLRVFACNASGCGNELVIATATRAAGPVITGTNGWDEHEYTFTIEAPIGNPDEPTQIWRCTDPGTCTDTDFFVGYINAGGYVTDHWVTEPNAEYCYTAVNTAGESVAACRFTPPDKPVLTRLTATGDDLPGSVLRVLGPADTYAQHAATSEPIAERTALTTTGLTVTGLTGNTEYCFTLRNIASTDGTGYDRAPYASHPTCVTTNPSAPTGLTATPADGGGVALTWTAPDGPLKTYIIEYKKAADITWTTVVHDPSTDTSYTVTTLAPGVSYLFRVRAVSTSDGVSTPSQPALFESSATPGAPRNVTARIVNTITATGGTVTSTTLNGVDYTVHTYTTSTSPLTFTRNGDTQALNVTWDAPLDNGGAPITNYRVEYRVHPDTAWSIAPRPDGTHPFTTITGLPIGADVDVRVTALNTNGAGTTSAPATLNITLPTQTLTVGAGTVLTPPGTTQPGEVSPGQCPAGTTLTGNACVDTALNNAWEYTRVGVTALSTTLTVPAGTETRPYTYHTETKPYTYHSVFVKTGTSQHYVWCAYLQTECWQTWDDGYYVEYRDATPDGWTDNGTEWTRQVKDPTPEGFIDTGTHWSKPGTPGTVVIRYPSPVTPASPVRNLTAAIDVTIEGGDVTQQGTSMVHVFRATDTVRVIPGGTALLDWDTPQSLNHGTILDYAVNYRVIGAPAWTPVIRPVSTVTDAAVTGLPVGQALEFQVTPVTEIGAGESAQAAPAPRTLEYFLVGGGGGGGVGAGGGGGAGGVKAGITALPLTPQTLTVTVGTGGTSGANGTASTLGALVTAAGGGAGGSNTTAGATGGSGGGGSFTANGGAGTSGQGFAGTAGAGGAFAYGVGGGGGGAGGVAVAGVMDSLPYTHTTHTRQTGTENYQCNPYQYQCNPYQCNPYQVQVGGGYNTTSYGGATWYGPNAVYAGSPPGYYCPAGWWLAGSSTCATNTWVPPVYETRYNTCYNSCTGWNTCSRPTYETYLVKNPTPDGYFDDGTKWVRIASDADAPGGAGVTTNITGVNTTYATGGRGGAEYAATQGAAGTTNTGNGGGGSATGKPGGPGGSGIVVIRYDAIIALPPIIATGGTISTEQVNGLNYTFHVFSNPETAADFHITSGVGNVDYYLVGGGGGGGGRDLNDLASGGGGGGGVLTGTVRLSASTTPVRVGAGGLGAPATTTGSNGGTGGSTSFGTVVAFGGGGGAAPGFDGDPGGSGGGGAQSPLGSIGGTPRGILQGNNGATVLTNASTAGGGGGATGPGLADGTPGAGVTTTIRPSTAATTYANGGPSGSSTATTPPTTNTGNGGKGGVGSTAGKPGGSGVVILRYRS